MSKQSSGSGAAQIGASMNNTSTGSATSAMRKIGDDPLLRPFLNSLFDPQAYVKTIIKDGKSEDCLTAINDVTEKINDEIQKFISKNKDNLMSGMQDISSLAERYHSLADHSKGLQTIVQRMKRETADSYNLIKSRTSELDRIHDASTLLNHVKRFVKAKAQLDQYLKNQDDKDLRSLASAAKVVAELEKLLTIPNIQGIKLVQESVSTIKNFGSNIRVLAQSKLLEATAEKNQAAMGHYLQVFYNLESLPEILLFTIDNTVRLAAEASKDALQLDMLTSVYHDYAHKHGAPVAGGLLPASATKRNASSTSLSSSITSTSSSQHQPVTISQLRITMREITHAWSTIIFERATQMLILQRVVAKKEDPITHVKFRDVLREKSTQIASSLEQDALSTSSTAYLAQGHIVALFWQRLSVALHEICSDKLRHHSPEVVCRMYPYLRRAAQDVLTQMQTWSDEVSTQTSSLVTAVNSTASFLNDGDWTIEQLLSMEIPTSPFQQDPLALTSMWTSDSQALGMFGSAVWHDDITRFRANNNNNNNKSSATAHLKTTTIVKGVAASTQDNVKDSAKLLTETAAVNGSIGVNKEADLVQGLQPIRDRFLLAVLDRMQHPISQMFPDLDGYVAAIPSKRDLLTLVRAIQQEYVTVATESSDVSFIALLNREVLKTIRLILTKMESMVISNGADVRRIATSSSSTTGSGHAGNTTFNVNAQNAANPAFVRTAPQEHNAQCFVLLTQLRDALQKLPTQVIQHLDESTTPGVTSDTLPAGRTPLKTPSTAVPDSTRKSSALTYNATNNYNNNTSNSVFVENVLREIARAMDQACEELDELMMRHILEPLLTLLTEYSLSVLSQLHRESVITIPNQPKATQQQQQKKKTDVASSNTMDLSIDNSLAVQSLLRQLPALLKTYFFALPKIPGSNLLERAGEELADRILMLYMSLASLSRPMTEAVRLRTAKDLSAIEMLLSQQFPHVSSSNKHCPVMREFRAFRRLLFEEQLFSATAAATNAAGNKAAAVASVPNRNRLLSLDYVSDLRPSTLLALLMAAGPAQLPLPADLPPSEGRDIVTYILDLVQAMAVPMAVQETQKTGGVISVRHIYVPTPAMHAFHLQQQSSHGHNKSHASSAVALSLPWKKISVEKAAWETIQHCLDVYFQRLSVAEVAAQKQEMRAWYEAIMDIGSHYFS